MIRFINIHCSVIFVTMTSVFNYVLHINRFHRMFKMVTIPVNSQSDKPIETCRSTHADWIQDTKFYEDLFMWGRIAVANLIPSILILTFITLMVRVLLKSDSFLLQANKDGMKTTTGRRQLSIIVIVIALIAVGVELSIGILMSLYELKISTGLFIVSFETSQLAAFAFDNYLVCHLLCNFSHILFDV